MAPSMHQNMQLETEKFKKNFWSPDLFLNREGVSPVSNPHSIGACGASIYYRAFAQPAAKSKSWIRP